MKIAIDCVADKLSASQHSHNTGWAYLRKHQLEQVFKQPIQVLHKRESWSDYDLVLLYHGINFKGTLNLFGGASEINAKYFERLLIPNVEFISLDIPMPDYGQLCSGRKTCSEYWSKVDWATISKICQDTDHMIHPELTPKLTMGDSHSFSAYTKGHMTIRKDGRTLAGVLKKSLRKEMVDHGVDPATLTHLTLYYGNIDVRHHIMREADPKGHVDRIIAEYEKQIKSLGIENIELVRLLPIEDESRRLPKTGYYEKTPFFGSWDQRNEIKDYFNGHLNRLCTDNGWSFFEFDPIIYKVDRLEFMTTYMEKPQSVHLAPKYHRTHYWGEPKRNALNF